MPIEREPDYLLNSRQRKSFFDVMKEGLVCYYSIKAYRFFFFFLDSVAPALKYFYLFQLCD